MSLCPCLSVKRIHDSSSRRCPSTQVLHCNVFALSFFSSACCRLAISAFHLSRILLKMSQHSPRAVRMTAPDKTTLRLAHTALVISYSVAFSGSVGRLLGSGVFSSICESLSDPELYSESSSDSDPLDDSVDDTDSAVGVPAGLADEGVGRALLTETLVRLSFFRTGSRAKFHGPVPFSVQKHQ